MEVSSLNLPGLALDFPWDANVNVGALQGDLNTTATTSTAVMPVLVSSHGPHPTAAVDSTLPLDPSFVDIDHPGLGSSSSSAKRKASVAGSGSTRPRTTSSSTPPSKLRSVSTPTPPKTIHPAPPRSSSKSRGHRSTKSHGTPHQDDHMQEDHLLNLLREFRAAKKKERECGVLTDAGTGSVSLSLGVKSLLSHAPRRPQQHQQPQHESKAAQDRDQASSPPSYDSTTRPGTPVGAHPTGIKTRQRSASTSTPLKLRARSKSTSGSTSEIIILLGTLRQETQRANAAEAQLRDLAERYKVMRQERLTAESQLAVIREELRLYKEQLDAAQKEIFRAQQIVESVDLRRVEAEREAQKHRERYRKLFEERLVAQAQAEGRREGYEEGMRRGRLAREEQEYQIELEKEEERVKRRRERERERQRREEERREREREREEAELRAQERERMEIERRERVRVELERLRRDREERERRELEKLEALRRERERLEAEQVEMRRREEARRMQEEEDRRREIEEWDRKTKQQPTQRARSNTLASAMAPSVVSSTSHRSRARSGSVPGLSRPANVLPPPPRPSTPLAPPPLPAKPPSPEHHRARSRTPAPPRSHTPHIPTAGPSTTPAGDPPPRPPRRPSPPNANDQTAPTQYVPLPQPPSNYIPLMNRDGSVPVPPPFGFKSPPRNNDGPTTRPNPPRPSSRAGDSVRGYANPDRERMRQRIIGAGSPETPTPRPGSTIPGGVRPFSRQGEAKGKGKMRVVNEEPGGQAQDRPAADSPPNGFPWFAPASEVVSPRVDMPTPPPSSNPNRHMAVAPAMFMSTPLQKAISPPHPGPGNANQSARSSGEESRWGVPDTTYGDLHPAMTAMTPMLVRTGTNGTTPTIGVEPPSHSPTTEAETSTMLDSGLLTADGTVAHHEREAEEHDHQSPPHAPTPQSYPYQPGPLPTPTDTAAPWPYTSPPQGQPPQYQRYDTNASASWVSNWNPNPVPPPQWGIMAGSPASGLGSGSVQDKSEWVPPPIVPLSPIPGMADYKFNAFAPPSSAGSPPVISPSTEKEVLNFGMTGMPGAGKFLSPAPLNRPISLFSDSDS